MPMRKGKDQWNFTISQHKLLGPRNPYQQTNNPQKAAMVAVTRSGMIRVLYQGQDNRWQDFKSESENIASPGELLTHATMCPERIVEFKTPDKGEHCHPGCDTVADHHNQKVPCFLRRIMEKRSFGYIDLAWISSTRA